MCFFLTAGEKEKKGSFKTKEHKHNITISGTISFMINLIWEMAKKLAKMVRGLENFFFLQQFSKSSNQLIQN